MTSSVEVVVEIASNDGGLAGVVGGAGVGDDCTPSELLLLGK